MNYNFNIESEYSKGIIIDSNLLILLLVGIYDRNYIPNFKRTRNFTYKDFDILIEFIHKFKHLFITPHILTEVSNLSKQVQEYRLKEYFKHFADILNKMQEISINKNDILNNKYIEILGVTDIGIMEASENNDILFLTEDIVLSNIAESKKLKVINFNYIKDYFWFSK